jgi:diaminopimelate decarboxylase
VQYLYSPCKTIEELSFALEVGVCINVNSLKELCKIETAYDLLKKKGSTFNY